MIRFVSIVLLSLISGLYLPANAGRCVCDQLLSSTALSGASTSAADLSLSAQAYVNIVQLYTKSADANLSSRAISDILSSPQFINPFASNKDSFSTQISAAVEQLRKSIDDQSWSQIKKQIQIINKKSQAEEKDRREKEDEASEVFSPYILDKKETVGAVQSSPALQVVGDRVFVAVGSNDGKLYFYELLDGKLKERGSHNTGGLVYSSPVWQVIDGRRFVAVGSENGSLFLYELVGDKLEERGSIEVGGYFQSTPAWQVMPDGRVFIAATSNSKLHLIELVDGNLHSRSVKKVNRLHRETPVWLIVGGRAFVTVAGWNKISVFELIDGEFQLRNSHSMGDAVNSPSEWHVTKDGRAFIAVGAVNNNFYLYELVNGRLQKRGWTWLGSGGGIYSKPTWQVVDGHDYVAIGSSAKKFYLYELVDHELQERSSSEAGSGISSSPAWQMLADRMFIAVGERDGGVYFYDLVGDEIVSRGFVKTLEKVTSTPVWHLKDNKAYVIVGSDDGHLYLIEAYRKLKK